MPIPALKSASVTSKPFGKTPDGTRVHLFTLTNLGGMRVNIATYGGIIVNLYAPDCTGKLADVVLGFSTIEDYLAKNKPYFGAVIGRFGNRIAKGRFSLDGKTYQLAKNDAPHTLHGGLKGYDKHPWTAEVVSQDPPSIRLSRLSPDGEEIFPGNLKIAVTYTLTESNELRIQYAAQTDKATVINLTNHAYFNLAGAGSGNVLAHQVKINASHYTPSNKNLIPTGEIKDVTGTPMDLRKWTTIGPSLQAVGGTPVGYDHNFVLDRYPVTRPSLAAEVREPKSGRLMKVYTDQPGIQFYTANFLDGTIRCKGGKAYNQHDGLCLETQHYPDSPNQPNFPTTVLRPGETFRSTTVYKFSAK